MKDQTAVRERYMLDSLPVRLGGLAANLARIKSFSDHPGHRDVVGSLVEQSKFFIEWTASDTQMEIQAELITLQILLAQWQHLWQDIWDDTERRATVAEEAGRWSTRVLTISGLLPH